MKGGYKLTNGKYMKQTVATLMNKERNKPITNQRAQCEKKCH